MKREVQFPSKIYTFRSGGPDMAQEFRIYPTPFFPLPPIDNLLHVQGHPGNGEITQQGEGTGGCD